VTFRTVLQTELDRRRAGNARYSLRAFARALSVDHSTLSQILRGKRRVTARNVRALGRRLHLSAAAIAEHCAIEHESAVLAALTRPGFRADSRWVATIAGIPLDDVNVTLHREGISARGFGDRAEVRAAGRRRARHRAGSGWPLVRPLSPAP
jgi:transcriptional regulator with XRE-family HTH domain